MGWVVLIALSLLFLFLSTHSPTDDFVLSIPALAQSRSSTLKTAHTIFSRLLFSDTMSETRSRSASPAAMSSSAPVTPATYAAVLAAPAAPRRAPVQASAFSFVLNPPRKRARTSRRTPAVTAAVPANAAAADAAPSSSAAADTMEVSFGNLATFLPDVSDVVVASQPNLEVAEVLAKKKRSKGKGKRKAVDEEGEGHDSSDAESDDGVLALAERLVDARADEEDKVAFKQRMFKGEVLAEFLEVLPTL